MMSSDPYETHELTELLREYWTSFDTGFTPLGQFPTLPRRSSMFRAIAARLETQDRQDAELWQAYNALLRDERLPNGDYVHALHCNASRRQPVGNGACSCGIGQRIRKILIPAKFGASETPQPPDLPELSDDKERRLEEMAFAFHLGIEGEYGCPGLRCPGVQRLIVKFRELVGVGLADWVKRANEASASRLHEVPPQPKCKTCQDSGFVAYWDGSNYAGEGCPDCDPGNPNAKYVAEAAPLKAPQAEESFLHPIQQVWFRAGLLACREYMARFVAAESPTIAASIRANWWPALGPDFGPPRKLTFAEVTRGTFGETDFRAATADELTPTQEALPIALGFLQQPDPPVAGTRLEPPAPTPDKEK